MKYDNTNDLILNECHNLFKNLKLDNNVELEADRSFHFEPSKW